MAAYETETALPMQAAIERARAFFEEQHGLAAVERLGPLQRWRGPNEDIIELRAFPARGGTRLEISTVRNDDLVLQFIRSLPRPGLLDRIRRWFGQKPPRA